MAELNEHPGIDGLRAKPPCIPEPSPALLQARAEAAEYRERRERMERRSLVRGLLVLALVVLGLSMVRAGWGRVFVPRWWRQW